MKNVVIIPVSANDEEDLELPLGKLGEFTLLEQVFWQAKKTLADNVLVTSNSKIVGRFCADNGMTFFPSSQGCPSGTHRCAEVAGKFKPDANVGNVICWPITYPFISPSTIDEMIALYYGEGVHTLASSILLSHDLQIRKEFNEDESRVKLRACGTQCIDFSRCPLPLALCHVGIYMYSLSELIGIGKIPPTKLSIAERLEQLAWMQYHTKISVLTIPRTQGLPVAIRTVGQLTNYQPQEKS